MANNASPTPIPLILTRPRPASEQFFAALPDTVRSRFTPIFSPLIKIIDLNPDIPMTPQDAAIFTSVNGVQMAPHGDNKTAFCIGAATTEAAKNRGWTAQQMGTDAQSLIATLTDSKPKQRLFHLSGQHTRGDVTAHLTKAGLDAHNIATYDQHLCDLTPLAMQTLAREKHVIVPLFSPRTAGQFAHTTPRTTSVHVIALSAAVADALGPIQLAGLTIAARPDAQSMGAALNEVTNNA